MRVMLSLVLAMVIATASACFPSIAAAQVYPAKPIRFIVPYTAGGATTALARLVGQKLTESWGQQVLVDNRPGASTVIGSDALAKSPGNGYTILLVASTHVVIPLLLSTPYDPLRDFAPIATVASSEYVLAVHPSVPANNLKEFIALARSRPGQLNYASSGGGGTTHLAGELFNMTAGVKMQHIPYKGGGPALVDVIGGQVHALFSPPINAVPHIKSGRLKPIAMSGEKRMPALPQVPTFTEAGLRGFNVTNWYGILAPAGTPSEIINKLSTEIATSLAAPDVRTSLDSQGMNPFISTPDQFAALMRSDMAKYAKVIKAANIKFDN